MTLSDRTCIYRDVLDAGSFEYSSEVIGLDFYSINQFRHHIIRSKFICCLDVGSFGYVGKRLTCELWKHGMIEARE